MIEPGLAPAADRLDRTRVTIRSGPLVGPVLARVVGIHAARAPLPLDRLEDAVLIADALAARAPAYALDDRLPIAIRAGEGLLELRVGPLRPGGCARVLEGAAVSGAGNVIERLADAVRIREGAAGDEVLVIHVGAGEVTA